MHPQRKNAFPLDYDQRHRGALNMDYRFADGDGGPVLENLGLNVLFTFNSGHRYTAYEFEPGTDRYGYLGPIRGKFQGTFGG